MFQVTIVTTMQTKIVGYCYYSFQALS